MGLTRYGSGKSTSILTLLRLLELQFGSSELGGIEIKQVRLELLRQRCFIAVSQEPLILPKKTLRFNLEPDASISDEILVAALTKAGLLSHFLKSDTYIEGESIIEISGLSDYPILDR